MSKQYTSIFVESTEDRGLLYNSYKGAIIKTKSYIEKLKSFCDKMLKEPDKDISDKIDEAVNKFNDEIDFQVKPDPIDVRSLKEIRNKLNAANNLLNDLLNKLISIKNTVAFGRNPIQELIFRSPLYAKEMDINLAEAINSNIRSVYYGIDYAEKALVDLMNLVDQDLNLITVVDVMYVKPGYYESTDTDESLEFFFETVENKIDNINTNFSYKQARDIYESLSKEDRLFAVTNGHYVDSPRVIARCGIKDKGFIEALKYKESDIDKVVYIIIAISPNHRREGLGKRLMSNMESLLKKKGVVKITYQANKKNKASIELAKSMNYQFYKKTKTELHYYKILNKSEKFYRITIDDIGVYEVLKKSVSFKEWKSILNDPRINWLPTPTVNYTEETHTSYFTKLGYDTFNKKTIQVIKEYNPSLLNKIEMKIFTLDQILNNDNIISYQDKYQIVIKEKLFTESMEDEMDEMDDEFDKEFGPDEDTDEDTDEIESDDVEEDDEILDEPDNLDNEDNEELTPTDDIRKSSNDHINPMREIEDTKNGVNRKRLYIAFIEYAKSKNNKNTFGSIFDKDIFHNVYTFVPEDMRYFYRLANPMLCIIDDLIFFSVSELKQINIKNSNIDNELIFAATDKNVIFHSAIDGKVYLGDEKDGKLVVIEELAETFDLYIQGLIGNIDYLNGK